MGLLRNFAVEAGIVRDDTELAAKPRWTDSNRIRFVRGLAQKLGGWTRRTSLQYDGICRGMLAWLDNANVGRILLGTTEKLLVQQSQTLFDITPLRDSGTLAANPFTTTAGSAIVTVADSNHGGIVGSRVIFAGAAAVGGITPDGEYVIQTAETNEYTIEHSSAATSSATGGGASVTYEYLINIGRVDATQGSGYGVGTYGTGTWGTPRTSFILLPPRTWTLDQFGQDVVACPRDGSIYRWQRDTNTRAQILANAPTENIGIMVTDERHLVALGAGGDKMKVEWASQDAPTVWSPSDQNTAGGRALVGGSEILFGLRTRGTNLIFTDASAWTMTFVGGLDVFGFRQVAAGASGIVSPRAACDVNGIVYWMGNNDFYFFDGRVRRIRRSKENRRFVFDNLNQQQKNKTFVFCNTLFSEIWWFYVSATATEIDRYIKVNYDTWDWDVGVLDRTAAIDLGVFPNPILAAPDRHLYDHESGVDAAGEPMNEYIRSSPIEISQGGQVVDIDSFMPDFKNLVGAVDVTLFTRYYPQGKEEQVDVGPVISGTEQLEPERASGRQASLRIGSDVLGTNWRLGAPKMEVTPGGER